MAVSYCIHFYYNCYGFRLAQIIRYYSNWEMSFHRNDITSHFSSLFSTCFVTTAFRNFIWTSTLPPTAFLPSIKGNVSCKVQAVSRGANFTTNGIYENYWIEFKESRSNLYNRWFIAFNINIYFTWGCSQHRVTSEKSPFRPDLDFSCSSFEHSLTSFFFDIDWNHNLVIVLWIVSVLDCRCFIFERSIFWIWKLNPV